jgi:hypothetical protein
VNDFSGYGEGYAAGGPGTEVREELGERLRVLAEACDSLQGEGLLGSQGNSVAVGLCRESRMPHHEKKPAFICVLMCDLKQPYMPWACVNYTNRIVLSATQLQ